MHPIIEYQGLSVHLQEMPLNSWLRSEVRSQLADALPELFAAMQAGANQTCTAAAGSKPPSTQRPPLSERWVYMPEWRVAERAVEQPERPFDASILGKFPSEVRNAHLESLVGGS